MLAASGAARAGRVLHGGEPTTLYICVRLCYNNFYHEKATGKRRSPLLPGWGVMRKRRLIKYVLIVAELFLAGYIVYLFSAGLGDRAPLLCILFAVLLVLLIPTLRSREDARVLARTEKVYAGYLDGVFEDAPALRRKLVGILSDTLTAEKHPALTPRLAAMEKRCGTDRERAVVWFFLARCYTQDGEPDRAEQIYRQALAADPEFSSAWSNLGVLLQSRRRYAEAEECMIRAQTQDPANAVKLCNLANLYILMHRPAEAKAYAERALSLQEGMLEACVCLSVAYAMEGNRSEARRYVRKSVKLGGDEKQLERIQNAVLRGDYRVLEPGDTRLSLSEEGRRRARAEDRRAAKESARMAKASRREEEK